MRWDEDGNYYDILDVPPTATGRDIYAAYLRAKQTYSPDSPALYSMFSAAEAREMLDLIEEAYFTLSHQVRREQYDAGLARRGVPGFKLKTSDSRDATIKGWEPAKAAATATEIQPRPSSAPAASEPGRVGRTRFGSYEINPRLEEEILRVEECDGAFLQRIRQYKNVSLDQLSEATKISKSYLAALEANALTTLPAAVFVRGFISQIARCLSLNETQFTQAYMRFFNSRQAR